MTNRTPLPLLLLLLLLVCGCSRDPGTDAAEAEAKPGSALRYDSPQELAAKAGVDLYPDAHVPNGKSSVSDSERETRYEIVMSTGDVPDKVLKFYESKLRRSQRMSSNKAVMGVGAKGSMVSVTAERKGSETEIHAVAIVEKA